VNRAAITTQQTGRTTRSSACYRQLVMGIVFNKLETTVEQTHVRSLATVNHRRPSRPAARGAAPDDAAPGCHRPALGAPRFPQRPADPCHPARARGQHRARRDLPAPRTHGELQRRGRPDSRGTALWLNESGPFATPAHWRPIDRAIVNLDIPTDAGKELFPDLDVVKPYLRYTGPLQSESDSQNRPGAQRSGPVSGPVSCLVPNEPGRRHRPLTVS
jgi:hypothetical protein